MPGWISSASTEVGARGLSPAGLRALKVALFLLCLLPLARLVLAGALGVFGGLGANPVEFVTRSTGTWTLVALCLTLAISPLRRLSGWAWLVRLRRMIGLFAFFYASLHLTTYLWFDQWFELLAIGKDVLRRPFIAAGFVTWLLLLPLAVTSTDAAMRRLGRNWGRLHRLVYLAVGVALLHYVWHKAGKNDYATVSIYAVVVAVLLAERVFIRLRRRA